MKRKIVAVAALAGAVLATGIAPRAGHAEAQQERYPWREMQQHAFDVTDGGTLSVRVDDADVAITVASGAQASVTMRLRSNDMDWATDRFERTNYRAGLDGNTVVVESDEEPRDTWTSGNWMSVLIEVSVPARFDLDVETQDGDVSVASFEGDAVLRSQDGDLIVDSLRGGALELRTQDGDVRAALLAGTSIQVRSQDGEIEIDTLRGAAAMHTQDGDIRIGSAEAPELTLSTGDGDIHLALTAAARLELDTHDGDISIEAPSSLRADIDLAGEDVLVRGASNLQGGVSDHRARGALNGGGERIRARTGDGAVRLILR